MGFVNFMGGVIVGVLLMDAFPQAAGKVRAGMSWLAKKVASLRVRIPPGQGE